MGLKLSQAPGLRARRGRYEVGVQTGPASEVMLGGDRIRDMEFFVADASFPAGAAGVVG